MDDFIKKEEAQAGAIVKYDITAAAIAEYKRLYMALVITDIEDKEQFEAVRSARLFIKGKRVEVEKRRKELNSDALRWQKEVNSDAKKIFIELEPIENHLQTEEDKVTEAEKRKKEESAQRERDRVQGMVDSLAEHGHHIAFADAEKLTWDEYTELLEWTKATHAEAQRKAQEEAQARLAEDARLKAEREEIERIKAEHAAQEAEIRKQQQAEAAKLAEERRKIEEAQAEERRKIAAERKAIEDEKARIAADEQAKREAEAAKIEAERLAKEATEKAVREQKAREESEAAEKVRQAALVPDREKLTILAVFLQDSIPWPEMATKEGARTLARVKSVISEIADEILGELQSL